MNDSLTGLSDREWQVWNHIHKNGPVTRTELTEKLRLKLSTLSRAMKALTDRGLIFESGTSGSSGGRKPSEFDAAPAGIYVVGVDISRTYAQIVLMNLKNQILEKERFAMDDGMTPQRCAGAVAGALERMTAALAIQKSEIVGIGVGTVGPLRREDGVLLSPKGFPNRAWSDTVPLGALLRQKTGMPCVVDNGANAAALLEYYFGAGRGSRCVAYIHCGVGIRSAVIRDGAVLRSMNDAEDAFAQMTIDINGGCVEDYVSLQAIRVRYGARTGRQISYAELFSRAGTGEEAACEAFAASAAVLSMGISNMAKLLNPDMVILSGPLVENYAPYYAVCMKAFRGRSEQNRQTAFSKSGTFGEDVVAVGAGLVCIESMERHFRKEGKQ